MLGSVGGRFAGVSIKLRIGIWRGETTRRMVLLMVQRKRRCPIAGFAGNWYIMDIWMGSDHYEIVGLDTSYHGGLILMGGEEAVNPEYILQFKKQRSNMRRRRTSRMNVHLQSSMDEEEGGDSGEGEAMTEPDNITIGAYATPREN
jgi:hypothetical protein